MDLIPLCDPLSSPFPDLILQRAFITVATAASQFESPLGYLAIYFALYLVSSLFIFGLEEGWNPLDCIYFSVITMTTTGLGDFVPTTDGAKIACSCFIYFGVGTIGLLLGSLLAGSLDDASKKDANESQIRDCPNCMRMKRSSVLRSSMPHAPNVPSENVDSTSLQTSKRDKMDEGYEELGEVFDRSYSSSDGSTSQESMCLDCEEVETNNVGLDINGEMNKEQPIRFGRGTENKAFDSINITFDTVTKPKRRTHTRHMSIDLTKGSSFFGGFQSAWRNAELFQTTPTIEETAPLLINRSFHASLRPSPVTAGNTPQSNYHEVRFFDESSSTSSSSSSDFLPTKPMSRLKAAKYVILTLKQALTNSVFIVALGR